MYPRDPIWGEGGTRWNAPMRVVWVTDLLVTGPMLPPMTVPPTTRHRRGTSTIEQLVVLTMLGLLATLAITSGAPLLQAAAVESASRETANLFALARDHALAAHTRTAVRFETAAQRMVVHTGRDTLAVADFRLRGVSMDATRDSMAYAPTGLGVGAANLRLILRRGGHADTLTVSRLGRVAQ